MKNIFFLLLITFSSYTLAQECDITPKEASSYIGKSVTICGVVDQVSTPKNVKGNPTYINMGGKFPDHAFTILIWEEAKEKMQIDFNSFLDQKIAVTGLIGDYKGKPQIMLSDVSKIKIIEEE